MLKEQKNLIEMIDVSQRNNQSGMCLEILVSLNMVCQSGNLYPTPRAYISEFEDLDKCKAKNGEAYSI